MNNQDMDFEEASRIVARAAREDLQAEETKPLEPWEPDPTWCTGQHVFIRIGERNQCQFCGALELELESVRLAQYERKSQTEDVSILSRNNYPILRRFVYKHLPPHLQTVSKKFHDLAYEMAEMNTDDLVELAVGLRKLLEAKDACVRARLDPPKEDSG